MYYQSRKFYIYKCIVKITEIYPYYATAFSLRTFLLHIKFCEYINCTKAQSFIYIHMYGEFNTDANYFLLHAHENIHAYSIHQKVKLLYSVLSQNTCHYIEPLGFQ